MVPKLSKLVQLQQTRWRCCRTCRPILQSRNGRCPISRRLNLQRRPLTEPAVTDAKDRCIQLARLLLTVQQYRLSMLVLQPLCYCPPVFDSWPDQAAQFRRHDAGRSLCQPIVSPEQRQISISYTYLNGGLKQLFQNQILFKI